jgi:hypothetical protein
MGTANKVKIMLLDEAINDGFAVYAADASLEICIPSLYFS